MTKHKCPGEANGIRTALRLDRKATEATLNETLRAPVSRRARSWILLDAPREGPVARVLGGSPADEPPAPLVRAAVCLRLYERQQGEGKFASEIF